VKRSLAVIIIFISTLLILSGGCVTLHKPAPLEQLTISEADNILSGIKDQSDSIRSFYSLGVISLKGRMLGSDADILIAGIREPFALKIEITHSWGKPVLYILIREGRLNVLSYQEKLKYSGTFSPEALSRFLPGFYLDQEMIWSILSGRPPLVSHEVVTLSGSDTISLRSGDGIELEAMDFSFGASFPEKTAFPVQSLDVFFSDLKEDNGIPYAGNIKLSGKKLEKALALKIDRMAFNASVPDQIFTLETPSDYDTVNLDDLSEDEEK
jgi:hypothetical protein